MSGDTPYAVRCDWVRVAYTASPAIDDIDMTIGCGEMVALLGASGSGKTTLLHCIAGLVQPSAGAVWLGERQVASPRFSVPPEGRAVGLVFQDFALWPHLSVLDTVAYPLRRAGRGRRDAQRTAGELLDRLDVGELSARRPAELSGGQQQRIGLARALARDPAVFLLDEPTAHLDTALRSAFQELVRDRLAHVGAAAVYATHDAAEALALADRVALLVGGRLLQLDAPETVYAEPVSAAAAALTGPCSVLTARAASGPPGRVRVDLGAGPIAVAGGGAAGADPRPAAILVRPDWVCLDGPLTGRVVGCAFRGAHTDYRLDTPVGAVHAQLPGPPRFAPGVGVSWGVRQAWVLPEVMPAPTASAQSKAAMAPG